MIPIIFDKSETQFKTNGLGRLSDAISCEVTEERNGSYELEMEYPVDGIHYSEIAYGRIIYAEPAEGEEPQPFEIYLITRPLNQRVTVHAEHISYRMKYIPTKPFEASGVRDALNKLQSNAVVSNPFTLTTDKSAPGTFIVENANSIRSFLTDGDDTITAVYGGEWKFDKFTAKLCKARGTDNGVTIRYGKNLTTLEQEENIENMVTGIYPYWKGQGDDDTDIYLELPEKVVNTTAKNLFPYQRVIAVDFSSNLEEQEITHNWTETTQEVDPSTSRVHTNTEEKSETIKVAPTADSLREQARIYIEENELGTPEVNLKVSFVNLAKSLEYQDIAELERVHLCDTVTVAFEKLGVSAKAKVTKTVYDVINERYTSIEVGNPKENLSSSFDKVSKEAQKAQSSADTAQSSANTANTNAKKADENANQVRKDLTDTIGKLDIRVKGTEDAQGDMETRIEANEKGLTTTVQKGSVISEINQSAEGVKIKAEKVNLEGLVTASDLAGNGTTTIDGSNIKTGKINAGVIDVENLKVSKIYSSNGTLQAYAQDGSGSSGPEGAFTIPSVAFIGDGVNGVILTSDGLVACNIISFRALPEHGAETDYFLRINPSSGRVTYTTSAATS